jgi:tRNA pseudouridine55 synthase
LARRRKGRRISGILLLDKPAGISSNAALQKVKWLYKAAKAGHTGSLDPLATGLLPVCLGEATKASAFLLDADKRYVTSIKLGAKTSTADAEGEIIETAAIPDISLERLGEVLEGFLGDIQQLPPMYSAVKHKGERLYKLAREGLEVERAPRTITIHDLVCLDFDSVTLQLEIHCSKGTYVRTLAEDISEALGTLGHVAELRRTAVGPFTDADMVSIEQLEARAAEGFEALDALLLPVDSGLTHWPEVRLNADASHYLLQGQAVFVPGAPTSGWVRIYDNNDRFLGAGQINSDGLVAPKRMMLAD